MTDVLLAHGFFFANDAKQRQRMRPYPPLATLYAASHLRSHGYSVALFDALFASGLEAFADLLEVHQPRIVAFQEDAFHYLNKMCLTHAREAVCRMSTMARSAGARVTAAGADVTDHAEVYLAQGCEAALVGEADHTLLEVVGSLLGRSRIR